MAFKALKGDVYKVTIFDYNITELVKKWPQHELVIAIINE
jgi:hypothetical protein